MVGIAGKLVAAGLAAAIVMPSIAQGSHARLTHLSSGASTSSSAMYAGASRDTSRVFFTSHDKLVPQDKDSDGDIYEYSPAGLKLISTSQYEPSPSTGAAHFGAASTDGSRVFFTTRLSLHPTDTDTLEDVYEYSDGTVVLVSTGQYAESVPRYSSFEAASEDGTRVIFHTPERLIFADDDSEVDLYARVHGRTELVSYAPGGGQESRSVALMAASADARVAVFDAAVPPVGGEWNSQLYVATPDGTVELPGGASTDMYQGPRVRGVSEDGAHVFYETAAALVPEDTDAWHDLYDFHDGVPHLLSQGSAGGNGRYAPTFAKASADGARVFFSTYEQLVPGDTDSEPDIYERHDGATRLVSTGPAGGNGPYVAELAGITGDGTTAFIHTKEPLTEDDEDPNAESRDVFARSGDETTLVSTDGYGDLRLEWSSPDGKSLIYSGGSQLLTHRRDGVSHPIVPKIPFVYEHLSVKTASPDGGRVVLQTAGRLMKSDQDSADDLYLLGPGDPMTYPRPAATSPMRVPLVPAFEQCTDPNTSFAWSSGVAACNPPVPSSGELTVGTPDFNGKPPRSQGSMTLAIRIGDPATSEDEADVAVRVRVTDVRKAGDLSDYSGVLKVVAKLRITDRTTGPQQSYPGTGEDIEFAFTVPCTETAGDEGATCELRSTLKALRCCVPRLEGKRNVMRVDDVRVYDSGPDGNIVTSADNEVFMWPGLFIP